MKREYSAPGDEIETIEPVTVVRYRGYTRLNHWVTAGCMIVLLLTGLAFFHPALFFLTGLFGGGQNARWLHPLVGVVLFISFFILFLQMWRLNLPNRDDIEWAKHTPDVLAGREENLPELGKYNAGQKTVFWAMAGGIVVLIVTGVMIWEQYFPHIVSIPVRRVAVAVHALVALGIVFVFILHVYAAIWTRGTIRAMTRGTVTGGWAFRHHRKWLRELAGRQGNGPAE
ncbi:formate dehydrogenase subunit gamma [Paenirhodobacter sp.]|uniref:formate dehydrogenase subunit gamma n=1 Tax=Paenirhodobacter sp. TaxID=1965326 RepID=UPI003B3F3E59